MSALLHPSTAILIAVESAFVTRARNLSKSCVKNILRYASAKMGKRVIVEYFLEYAAYYHFDFELSIVSFCSLQIIFLY